MATAVSKPPSAPRMKRPPVPNVQTGGGIPKPAGTAQSPNTPSKRPPSATTPTTAAGTSYVGSGQPRGPIRRASQRPMDAVNKPARPLKAGETVSQAQRAPEPLVKTTEYILSKYAKRPPSLVVHLHPTHFRFDQQDGSWSYQSQMKVILESIKAQAIPYDLVDELLRSGTQFYEGCLIVQIRDHRHAAATKERVSKDDQKENNQPFSMHKHSKFLVPSPYVPYPLPKQISPDRTDPSTDNKQNVPATESVPKPPEKDPELRSNGDEERVFTTVLFPSYTNLNTEILDFAAWKDQSNFQNQKRSTAGPRAGTSGAISGAPPAKRQKLLGDITKLQEVEAKIIAAVAPPLYLDPVENMDQAQELLAKLRDPRFNEEPPAPKSRKRTIAELAADEALAAEEQRFMLIMDERLQPSASGNAAADTDTGGAAFEPRFERFKAIEEIRRQQLERQREEAEAKVHAKAEQERSMREQQAQDLERQKIALEAQRRQAQAQAQARARAAAQANMQASQNPHGHLNAANNGVTTATQNFTAAQVHQGSPALRNMTPHSASSPVNAQPMAPTRSAQGGIPMVVNNSRQGSGSPPRPGSALQHTHPASMVAPQQPPSRNGTPHIPAGTPRMQNSTPVMHNMVGTPRMNQASPAMTSVAATTVQAPTMIGTPQMPGRSINQLTSMQQQQFAAIRQRQQLQAQQQHQAQQQQALARGQGSPPMMQISGPGVNSGIAMNHNQQQLLQQQAQMRANTMNQENAYRQQLQNLSNGQMTNGQPMHNMINPGQQPQQQPQNINQQMQNNPAQRMNQMAKQLAVNYFNTVKQGAIQRGEVFDQKQEQQWQFEAMQRAKAMVRQQFAKNQNTQMQMQAQRLQQQQQQQQQQMAQQHQQQQHQQHQHQQQFY